MKRKQARVSLGGRTGLLLERKQEELSPGAIEQRWAPTQQPGAEKWLLGVEEEKCGDISGSQAHTRMGGDSPPLFPSSCGPRHPS